MGKNGQKWVSFLFKVVFRNILNCCSCNNATNTRVYCSIFMKLPTVVNIPVSNKLTSQGDCVTFQSWEKEIDTISPCFGETRSYVMLKIIDMSKSFNSSRHLSVTLPMYLLYLYVCVTRTTVLCSWDSWWNQGFTEQWFDKKKARIQFLMIWSILH